MIYEEYKERRGRQRREKGDFRAQGRGEGTGRKAEAHQTDTRVISWRQREQDPRSQEEIEERQEDSERAAGDPGKGSGANQFGEHHEALDWPHLARA